MKQFIFLLWLFSVFGTTKASAQRDIVYYNKHRAYYTVPGPEKGSLLVSRQDDNDYTVFYSENGHSNFRVPTSKEVTNSFSPIISAQYHWYDVLPSGRMISRGERGKGLYLLQPGGFNPVRIADTPELKYKTPDAPFIQFVSEKVGFIYMYNSTSVYQTTNGGKNWAYQGDMGELISPHLGFIKQLRFLDSKLGFALLELRKSEGESTDAFSNPFYSSKLVCTHDGGRSWEEVLLSQDFTSRPVNGELHYLHEGGKIYMLCYGDTELFTSEDNGKSFRAKPVKSMAHWKPNDKQLSKQMVVDETTYAPFRFIFFNL